MTLTNLVFVILDSTGIKRDSDIIRVLVVNLAGEPLYHQIVKPVRQPNEPNSTYTGLSQADLDAATTLAEQWPAIQAVLSGKYVMAYGLDFVQARFADNAQAYHLPPIFLVGDCLHEFSSQYAHRTSIKLTAAMAFVGFPRLDTTTALSRAQAQITLLKAIADGQPKAIAAPPKSVATGSYQPDNMDEPF
jgi:hypothetical protein